MIEISQSNTLVADNIAARVAGNIHSMPWLFIQSAGFRRRNRKSIGQDSDTKYPQRVSRRQRIVTSTKSHVSSGNGEYNQQIKEHRPIEFGPRKRMHSQSINVAFEHHKMNIK